MNKIKNGGPAYPHDGQADYTGGLTVRDYFAVKAMEVLLSSPALTKNWMEKIAKDAYTIADEMLAERERGE